MSFRLRPLDLADLLLVEPTVHRDDRGFFLETYREAAFREAGLDLDFVQDNLARSTRGVLRGLHYQRPPRAQGKLVRCVQGRIFDVAVDLREGSPTAGRWAGVELDDGRHHALWVPPGFAHGYQVLSETALVSYKVTAPYAPEAEGGVRWDDPDVGIEWPIERPVLSGKDRALPSLADTGLPFRRDG